MTNKVKNIVGRGEKKLPETNEEFYALQDINFEVYQGDRLGIIGRNGAGKSTLLKILSRITEPTSGRITIRGRVASACLKWALVFIRNSQAEKIYF